MKATTTPNRAIQFSKPLCTSCESKSTNGLHPRGDVSANTVVFINGNALKLIHYALVLLAIGLLISCGGGTQQSSAPSSAPSNPPVVTGLVQDRIGDNTIRVNNINIQLTPEMLATTPLAIVGTPVRITLTTQRFDESDESSDEIDLEIVRPASSIDVLDTDEDDDTTIEGRVTDVSTPNFTINSTLVLVGPDTEFETRDGNGVVAVTRAAFYAQLRLGARAAAEGCTTEDDALVAEEVVIWIDDAPPPNVPPAPPPTTSPSPIVLAGPISSAFDATANRVSIVTVPIQITPTTTIVQATGELPAPAADLRTGRRAQVQGDLVNGLVQARRIIVDGGPQPGGVLVNAPLETVTAATQRATALGLTLTFERGTRVISVAGTADTIATSLSQWRANDRILALGIPAAVSQPRRIHTATVMATNNSEQTTISERIPIAAVSTLDKDYDTVTQSITLANQTIRVVPETVIQREGDTANLPVADLRAGMELDVRGYQRDSLLTAETITILAAAANPSKIAGPYTAFDPTTRSLRILNEIVSYSGATEFFDATGLVVSLSDFVLAAPEGSVISASGSRDANNVFNATRLDEIAKVYTQEPIPVVKVAGTISEAFSIDALSLSVADIPIMVDSAIEVRQPDGSTAQPIAQLLVGDPVVVTGRLAQAGFIADDMVRLSAVTGAVELSGPVQQYDVGSATLFLLGQALRITADTAVNTIGMPAATAQDLIAKLTPWTRLHVLTQIPVPAQSSWDALAIEARLFFTHSHGVQISGPITRPFDPATAALSVLNVAVSIDANTRIVNAANAAVDPNQLALDTRVSVDGSVENGGQVIAKTIFVLDAGAPSTLRLRGPVLDVNPTANSVNLLGSTVTITPTTRLLESVTVAITPEEFWTGVSRHSLLQIDGASIAPSGEVEAELIMIERY